VTVIIIGLGNPILGDDGVGWRVAERVRAWLTAAGRTEVEVDCLALGGLSLMERLVGYDQAILIDATQTGQAAGTVARHDLEAWPDYASFNSTAPHDASLQTALRLGRALGARLPRTVTVVGVEAERLYDFAETLTPAVEAAVPVAAQMVIATLRSLSSEEQSHDLP
jgi:hydrogenase maturation protease